LDPLATGVLLVGLGRATRLLEYLAGHGKEYKARVRLGESRDTLDREGELLTTLPVPDLDSAQIEEALARFRGVIVQVPPVYSAVKVRGVPLHRRARRGEAVEAPPRTVELRELELLERSGPDLVLRVACSAGTYVRSLARDLGEALGTAGALWELTRTRSGPFSLADARSLAEVQRTGPDAWPWVLPVSRMVEDLQGMTASPAQVSDLCAGRALACPGEEGDVAVFDETGALVAVARRTADTLRPAKVVPDRV
ncbi:MAG: tRNA pseudouridine(55) synthase TruB, partial [Proteobacteria bacterium]|nr:tRNA pseudouridine(55) synthase TruB [Pseudomonadota bacterium]